MYAASDCPEFTGKQAEPAGCNLISGVDIRSIGLEGCLHSGLRERAFSSSAPSAAPSPGGSGGQSTAALIATILGPIVAVAVAVIGWILRPLWMRKQNERERAETRQGAGNNWYMGQNNFWRA